MKAMVHRFEGWLQASEAYLQVRSVLRRCPAPVQQFVQEMEEEGLRTSQSAEDRQQACAAIAAAVMAHAGAPPDRLSPKHAVMVRFAEQMRTLRAKKGLTQAELGCRVGVQQSAISMMESGQFRPQPETLNKLAQQLGVGPQELWPQPERDTANGRPSRRRPGRRQ